MAGEIDITFGTAEEAAGVLDSIAAEAGACASIDLGLDKSEGAAAASLEAMARSLSALATALQAMAQRTARLVRSTSTAYAESDGRSATVGASIGGGDVG
jgi:tRNA A-37 threonylcarbamoyl transferase component Bud32